MNCIFCHREGVRVRPRSTFPVCEVCDGKINIEVSYYQVQMRLDE